MSNRPMTRVEGRNKAIESERSSQFLGLPNSSSLSKYQLEKTSLTQLSKFEIMSDSTMVRY